MANRNAGWPSLPCNLKLKENCARCDEFLRPDPPGHTRVFQQHGNSPFGMLPGIPASASPAVPARAPGADYGLC